MSVRVDGSGRSICPTPLPSIDAIASRATRRERAAIHAPPNLAMVGTLYCAGSIWGPTLGSAASWPRVRHDRTPPSAAIIADNVIPAGDGPVHDREAT